MGWRRQARDGGRPAGAAHDLIDGHLACWAGGRALDDVVVELVGRGIPAAAVGEAFGLLDNPQLLARGAVEPIDTPRQGRHRTISLPFRFASRTGPWIRSPAPTLGQHNRAVLVDLLGLGDAELERIQRKQVIGTRPLGS